MLTAMSSEGSFSLDMASICGEISLKEVTVAVYYYLEKKNNLSLRIKALAQAFKLAVLKKCVTDDPHQLPSCCTDHTLVISFFAYPQDKFIPTHEYSTGWV